MSLTAADVTADVAEALFLQPAELDHQLDLRDQGMDSVRTMELVDRWRRAGVPGISFIALAEDRRLERWIEVVRELQPGAAEPPSLRTCIATVSLGGSLTDKLDAVAAAGFGGIELLDADLRDSSLSASEVAARCADLGLTIDAYQPFRRAEGVSAAEFTDVLARFRGELDVMAGLGTGSILVVSNTDDDADPDRDLSARQLSALADAAAERGMSVTYEALAWGTHVGRFADAWDVVRRAGHPALTVTVDTFHMISRGEDAGALDGVPMDKISLAQVADAPMLSMDLKQWSRNHRCLPGDGEFDLRTPLRALWAAGYRGPLSLEIFNPEIRAQPPHDVAARGARALDALLAELDGAVPGPDASGDPVRA
ncbi:MULTISPECIES: TIM barrel protein [unclassified Pseudonocardia]|uniref:TIM barrel protein n=1 Tax=unclassified Pseudonocardia TaxID=2619320 RepID=UPI0002E60106|nr:MULTISPECIES: TIM barrel protein [unclassified Pseudonocardia]OLM17379.1 4-hydroxyphenylpyruvate dioxygenase [Pseudonocardia sp. Ae707_Ps1]